VLWRCLIIGPFSARAMRYSVDVVVLIKKFANRHFIVDVVVTRIYS